MGGVFRLGVASVWRVVSSDVRRSDPRRHRCCAIRHRRCAIRHRRCAIRHCRLQRESRLHRHHRDTTVRCWRDTRRHLRRKAIRDTTASSRRRGYKTVSCSVAIRRRTTAIRHDSSASCRHFRDTTGKQSFRRSFRDTKACWFRDNSANLRERRYCKHHRTGCCSCDCSHSKSEPVQSNAERSCLGDSRAIRCSKIRENCYSSRRHHSSRSPLADGAQTAEAYWRIRHCCVRTHRYLWLLQRCHGCFR